MNEIKIPPFSEDAERSFLGSVFMDNSILTKTKLDSKKFYFKKNAGIFWAMTQVEHADLITVSEKLEKYDVTLGEIAEVSSCVPSPSHWKSYEKVIYQKWQMRQVLEISENMKEMAYNETPIEEIIIESSKVNSLCISEEIKREDPLNDMTKSPTWGTDRLNKTISPIGKSHLVIVAGETGIGKTAYTFFMAKQNALEGKKVLYISLEMCSEEIVERISRESACITKEQWRDKKNIRDHQIDIYKKKKEELLNIPNLICHGFSEGSAKTVDVIIQVCKEKKPDLVFIDNLGCIQQQGKDIHSSEAIISTKLRDYSKHNQVPVVLLHHFAKPKAKEKPKPRTLNELRGNSQIMNDSSIVIQTWRNMEAQDEESKASLYIIQMKDREFGSNGKEMVYFNKGEFQDEIPDLLKDKLEKENMFYKTAQDTFK